MGNNKPLPAWAKAELNRRIRMRGAKMLYQAVKIRPETLKRLDKTGYGRADVVDRIVQELEPKAGANGKEIVAHVEARRGDIKATIAAMTPGVNSIPKMLAAFIMRRDAGLDRRQTADELGYSSIASINHAEKTIWDEMESNKTFRKLVYEIKGELGY